MENTFSTCEYLEKAFAPLGIRLSEAQTEAFLKYAALLAEWNKVMNLTAITEPEEVAAKHFADSCAAVLIPEGACLREEKSLIDVGTGAGFPGIPLKILFPQLKVTLLDSLGKRVKFLEAVIAELGLKDIKAIHARAEDGARLPELRDSFDICASRAVAHLSVLSEYCLPYLKEGGVFLAYKSGDIETEIKEAENAVSILGGKREALRQFTLPGTDLSRSIVVIRKVKKTPKTYPRKAGTAAKKPL